MPMTDKQKDKLKSAISKQRAKGAYSRLSDKDKHAIKVHGKGAKSIKKFAGSSGTYQTKPGGDTKKAKQ
jgi:hypothetical protein